MKIAYVGNFEPRHSTENHIAATLRQMDIDVLRIQESIITTSEIYKIAKDCDLFMYTRTWGFVDGQEAGNRLLNDLAAAGVPTVSYHLDLYVGISREGTLDGDPFWRTKYVFTPDGDPHSEEVFKQKGINHFYLRPGVYKSECYYGRPQDKYQYDVIFVGSDGLDYHFEYPYRRQLVEWLQATYGSRFMRFGNRAEVVRNEDLNNLYASAKVVVGDSLCQNFTHTYYWSDRVYETLGRGGFLIHPYIKGLEDEFADDVHLRYYRYGDFNQLKELIDRYVNDYAERERIRLAGHLKVKNECTYTERLSQMLLTLADKEPNIKEILQNERPTPQTV